MPEIDFDGVLAEAQVKLQAHRAAEMYMEFVENEEALGISSPHCDARVLHSPGLCTFCDEAESLQDYRKRLNLKFTDELQANEPLLPGEDRTKGSAEGWSRNWIGAKG